MTIRSFLDSSSSLTSMVTVLLIQTIMLLTDIQVFHRIHTTQLSVSTTRASASSFSSMELQTLAVMLHSTLFQNRPYTQSSRKVTYGLQRLLTESLHSA